MESYLTNERTGKIMPHPPHLSVIPKIQNALDDIAGVFFWINGFGINIPEERRAEFDRWYLSFQFGCSHAFMIAKKVAEIKKEESLTAEII